MFGLIVQLKHSAPLAVATSERRRLSREPCRQTPHPLTIGYLRVSRRGYANGAAPRMFWLCTMTLHQRLARVIAL